RPLASFLRTSQEKIKAIWRAASSSSPGLWLCVRLRADSQLTRFARQPNLERTMTMAITASFSSGSRVLSVFGDSLNTSIKASRDLAGNILIDGGAVAIVGGKPTVANTDLIQVFGQGGNDTITVDEGNGPMPAAHLFGGDGNDVLTGGSSADLLFGQSGND